MTEAPIGWIAVIIAIANLSVSVLMIRSGNFDPLQTKLQMLMVWLLPVVGALLVGIVLWSMRSADRASASANHLTWEAPPGANLGDHHAD